MNYFSAFPYGVAITGAASGIGKAAAELMASQGVSVGCIDRDGTGRQGRC